MISDLNSIAKSEVLNRVADIPTESRCMLPPIRGFENEPLVTLNEAVEPLLTLVPNVEHMVWVVTEECSRRPATHLTFEERASIMLYTLEWFIHEQSFYFILNQTLRLSDRRALKPWFLFLKLFISALSRLPSISCHIYRGCKENLAQAYPTGSTFIWWAFSSCTKTIEVLETETFFGRTGPRTIFSINCSSGIDIGEYSFHPDENEILLMAARRFQVDSCVNLGNGLQIIDLKEISAPFPLLGNVSTSVEPIPKLLSKINKSQRRFVRTLPPNTRWNPQGVTVLKGLNRPVGLTLDEDDGILYVADHYNHRIIAISPGNDSNIDGRVAAGGNGQGSGLNQLSGPTDVLIDKETRSLIISDWSNNRVMRWSLDKETKQGEIMIDNIQDCSGLAIDGEGALYISSTSGFDARRFSRGDKTGTIVAGGNGQGNGTHQLNNPYYIAVDDEGAVYVSDFSNHRVMKWSKGAAQGVTVAGGRGPGSDLTQLWYPNGVLVDTNGTVYVAEGKDNQRVTRWLRGATKGEIIVGGNGRGSQMNQFNGPVGLSFDSRGNLFVTDWGNNRVQRFSIASTTTIIE